VVTAVVKRRALIVDNDAALAQHLASHLMRQGFEPATARAADDVISLAIALSPRLILLALTHHGAAALHTIEQLHRNHPEASLIVISSIQDSDLVFKISKAGADDFLHRPFELKELDARIARLLDNEVVPAAIPAAPPARGADFSMIFGTSPRMEEVKQTIEKVADTNVTVLIRGESGTGKEMVARMVYQQSLRADRPFVKVNCAAIPNELLESELFGYEQGAFTGANRQKLGKFDLANTGTLFLDEISEMHPALQAKLLHVLQDGEFSRLGGKRDIAVDVRVLAATNKPLERAVAEGAFRQDLFYRLNVVTVHIPPLRDRREEIPVFLDYFLGKYSVQYNKHPGAFSDYALQRILDYDWPGNIRELENLVKRYVIVGNEAQIIRELSTHKPILSSYGSQSPEPQAANKPNGDGAKAGAAEEMPSLLEIGRRAAMRAEREAIERVLHQTRWNRRQAAKILRISYKALLNKLKLYEEQDQADSEHASA
jgi:two-component system response regulator AtoC